MMGPRRHGISVGALLLMAATTLLQRAAMIDGFYVPGTRPKSFKDGEEVELKVNKLTSTESLPYHPYRLPFCQPGKVQQESENLGEFLAGDRIDNSPYKLLMRTNTTCEQVCASNLGRAEKDGMKPNRVVRAIRLNYHHNWIVDNLPAASKSEDDKDVTTRYWQGIPIGFLDGEGKAYVNNHVNIEIMYHHNHREEAGTYRVVRFTVEPFSIKHTFDFPADDPLNNKDDPTGLDDDSTTEKIATITNPIPSCVQGSKQPTTYEMVMKVDPQPASGDVLFTYDVSWVENKELEWASRWDIYLTMDGSVPAKVHWLSIANSLVIVFVLSAMIAAILVRNLRRDINRYNQLATDEEKAEDLEEYGWKLVHADVFRPPSFSPLLLAVCCGTGAQLLCMAFLTIIFSTLGFMSPARRGHLLMMQLLLFVMMGAIAGYVTARFYKTFKGKEWQSATMFTALGLPGIGFGFFTLMNIVALIKGSSDAVPFVNILILLVLWLGISTPLVFVGAYFGYKQDPVEFPVNTSSIPRQIPDQPWFMGVPFTLMIGGILPFGSCFVELYYILASVWMEYYYYVFGFLFLVFIILIVTCAEITVLFTYFQLCSEDYHWWWRSFSNAGSTAIYVFLYSFVYFKNLHASNFATYFLYFGYMSLASLALFTMMGFVGVSTSLWFNKTIFASIKID